ncbi:hypothetical protein I4U23_015224 [Adineta vaga]|nr:hypothetical protein I4U23_015224 [Adineta vaga]
MRLSYTLLSLVIIMLVVSIQFSNTLAVQDLTNAELKADEGRSCSSKDGGEDCYCSGGCKRKASTCCCTPC